MKKKALIMIIFAGILWGTSCIYVKLWEKMLLNSIEMTALRIIAAFLSFFVFTLLFNKRAFKTKISDVFLYVGSGVTLFATAAFYYTSM